MKCPRCDQPLTVRRVEGVEVHVCNHCDGMFLAHGELNKVAEPIAGDLELSTVDLDSFEHDDAFGATTCPCCDVEMQKVEFNVYSDIILDYCQTCRGFWLDGHELDRINDDVKRLNEAAREVPDPPMLWFVKLIWSFSR